jgi:osmoprotectant transport system ATP-binding protein
VNPSAALLDIRNLSCRIGGRWILRNVNLQVAAGETVVLLGRSGCGKTTLLKCVNGLVRPAEGDILFQDRSTTEWDPYRMRRGMGYVIQDFGLFPHWTVAANAGLVLKLENWEPDAIEKRVYALLEAVGLRPAEFAARYPRQLSGGQKQRVGIARALAADPPLLLLDEPFAALDAVTRFELQRQFLRLRADFQKTALFVTHDIREALMLASRIVLLKDGAIDVIATPSDFLSGITEESRAFLAAVEADLGRPHEPGPGA